MRLLILMVLMAAASAADPVVTTATDTAGNRTTTTIVTNEKGAPLSTTVRNASGRIIKMVDPDGDVRLFSYDYLNRIIRVDIVRREKKGTMSIMYADDGSIDKVMLPDGTLCNCAGHPVRWENGNLLNVPGGGPEL